MRIRSTTPRRRLAVAVLALVATGSVVFTVLAPPERCPSVTSRQLRASATAAVQWFDRNQRADGTWLYLYDAPSDTVTEEYNLVRHAGVTMVLYQAVSARIAGAIDGADRGLAWLLDRLVERDDWIAVTWNGYTPTGATALLVASLAQRRAYTEDVRYDDLLQRLGRFLVAQTEPSGAVLASYDLEAGAPVPGGYSKYYTGETYWALARLHRAFPDGPFGDAADRIGSYLATRRDYAEGYWPDIPDHWAAYGLAETVAFTDRAPAAPLTGDELVYARRQAELSGMQVRWLSQRFGPWGRVVRGSFVPRGGGYGVVGEALTGLWRVAEADPRLAALRRPIAERATCMAGLAIRAQVDAGEARAFKAPSRAAGAWFRNGETRMDDQQHAMAALLRTVAIVETGGGGGGSPRPAPAAWLWVIAVVVAWNPCRTSLGVPRRERTARTVARVAALGGALGAVLAIVAALSSTALIDAADVSEPAVRLAAGVVGVIAGMLALVRSPPSPEPGFAGWRVAIVPVAIPLVASPALLVVCLGAHADHGVGPVLAGLAFGLALHTMLAAVAPGDSRELVLEWAARVLSTALIVLGGLFVISGIFDV